MPNSDQTERTETSLLLRNVQACAESVWPLIVLGSTFVLLAAWSWRKWADILIDFPNELYVPWRLVEGDVLYRDLMFTMGPLSQYFNALLFRLFGVSLSTLIFCNLAILSGITFLIYRLFRRLGSRQETVVVCLFFLGLFGFSQYTGVANYNYICPYRHEMTHGMALCLLQVLCLVRFSENRRWWVLTFAGVCCGAIALMKVELFFVSGMIAAVSAGLLMFAEPNKVRFLIRGTGAFLSGVFAPVVLMIAFLATNLSVKQALNGTFANWFLASNSKLTTEYPMYQQLMGLDQPVTNSLDLSHYSMVAFSVVMLVLLADVMFSSMLRSRRVRVGVAIVLGLTSCVLLPQLVPASQWTRLSRILPVVAFLSGTLFFWMAFLTRKQPELFRRYFLLTLWSLVSLLLLPKMILNAQISHYGFVLAMPSSLLVIFLGISIIPQALKIRFGSGELFRAVMFAILLNWAATHWVRAYVIYRGKTLAIGSGGDITYHDPHASPRNAVIPNVIEELRDELPEDATLLVLPNGTLINYLLKKRNPTPHFLLTPWEILVAGGEAEVLKSFQKHPPDYVLVIVNDMQGHGVRYFGDAGYGDQIMKWIEQNYDHLKKYQSTDAHQRGFFAVSLFRSKTKEDLEGSQESGN
ncbi:MAG: hypothetical protein IID46_01335 [Planctomycetes bacterium]|nr:hypothetical protein [Planctomycetota bacterium]